MKRNHALAGLAAVAVIAAALFATVFLGGDSPEALRSDLGPQEPVGPERTATELDSAGDTTGEASPGTRTVVVEPSAIEMEASDDWASELGGLIGRVIEEDQTPVAGISVALVQVDANLLLAADWATLGEQPPQLVIGETVTDDEGRFRLDGGYDSSFQGLGIDLRGPRSTVRIVDTQLHHREVTDVGDIVLPEGCTVTGRVVDAAGTPVPAARVRILPVPPIVGTGDFEEFLQFGVQDIRADCAVGITSMIVEGEGSPVIEPPPLIRQHLDDLPIPTAYTNAEGEYRFEGAPIGRLIQGVDKRGLLGISRLVSTADAEPGGVVELEDAQVLAGRTVSGVVVDDSGDPVADAEVMAGSVLFVGEAGILHPAGRTGPDGRFSVAGCPETGDAMACARRSRDEPWVGALAGAGEELEIELESTFSLTVRVVDFKGDAVRGARVELAPAFGQGSPMGMLTAFMNLGAEPLDARFDETQPGTYVCGELTPGKYQVTARPQALASMTKEFELWEGKAEVTLICERGRNTQLTVVDAETGQGVRGARASLVGMRPPLIRSLAVGRTDEEGRVELGPYSANPQEANARGNMGGMPEMEFLVQHPRYADASAPFVEGMASTEIALQRGGEIRGRIQWGADPPRNIYTLFAENRGDLDGIMEVFMPPRIARSSLDGSFRLTNLTPGKYRIAVFERFLDGDPIAMAIAQIEPTMVHREEDVIVEVGGTTEIVIDLSPSGRGQTARIAGSISIDGRPAEGAEVRVNGIGPGVEVETDAFGNYETPHFLALRNVQVRVSGDVPKAGGGTERLTLYSESISVEPQTVHRLDLDLRSETVRVKVTGSDGQPVAGARVRARSPRSSGASSSATTDEVGEAELTIVAGVQTLTVSASGYAEGTQRFDTGSEDYDGEVEIELSNPAPCAGTCDLTAFSGSPMNMVFMRVDGKWERLDKEDVLDDRRAAFRLNGLSPGQHSASVWVDGEESEEVPFELPEGGAEDLLLVFVRAGG